MSNLRKAWAAIAFVLVSLAFVSPAFAGTIGNQRITTLAVYNSSTTPYVVVMFATGSTSPAACANPAATSAMAFDPATARGKVLLSMLTAAFLAGKPVSLVGSGTGNVCVSPAGFLGGTVAVETVIYALVQ